MAGDETTFRLVFSVLILLLSIIRAYYFLKVRSTGRKVFWDRESIRLEGRITALSIQFAGFVFFVIFVLYAVFPDWISGFALALPDWLRWLGALLSFLSLLLFAWTHQALGASWALHIQPGNQGRLVTTGPYSRVRHPMYSAIFLFLIGISLVSSNLLIVLLCAASIILIYLRIKREEELLIMQFGGEYTEYMKRTGKLLPKF
ncbi:putative protein-S-isoprenylcysteine methyltransferase [Candidatus Methanoperedens nitroreducens]|uniref:Isoprenylcysteine carboxylmethyltransferase family protein n=1 Tax=Candidatus Methanoperedens nitratireducens TaxID=1392998 RepID=A0A062VAP9_9EURY|nr:isoprenylcysteine carboxylmethyltransferase family protein [Candidatus Methanoperedens nitroreducens]KCZ73583.1 putative protein-S-isoprenylcysteine methyltransferase [Candidatus Methanoperedens nitroreducens]MDJ1422457.1 isoprenylcysteine carboxylmethyltransferase family protein [Candidatus Methanoperedens sp.]